MKLELRSRFYSLVTTILTPLVLIRLATRGIKTKAYLQRWHERFGWFKSPKFKTKSIWVHAVSVGEVNAAIPLIKALMEKYQDHCFVLTTITPTGSDRVQQIFGDQVFHVYLPYDLPGAVKRFLRKTKPDLAVIMETEIWPNLFRFCKKRDIPIVVANARLSEVSMKGYRWVESLAAKAFNDTAYVAAQTITDAKRMIQLGCYPEKIFVVGSLKFDIIIEDPIIEKGQEIRDHYQNSRLVWIAASTHQDDEIEVLDAYAVLKQRHPKLMLVIVPRHPERFQSTTQACRQKGFNTQLRSENGLVDIEGDVFVVDTMGEMLEFYASSDIAFVGGSIANIGGHNVLEAAVFSLPVLVGPNTHNFTEITQILNDCGGSQTVHDANDIIRSMEYLIENQEARIKMGQAAYELVKRNRGAVQLTMNLIESAMEQKPLNTQLKAKHFPKITASN
ncbi:lipid IV(A) 3-deoxy-D-manno-octulosonic acid transferase [Marinicella sp. S1101]|uniref:lipid IV(A) 3-deoxy-D-manno-octulosonic acid transferase n=1 Tax=Marinicella marina TaxID=2996016 RepID=UPI00226101D2|nr:lipid IV(A) 3-deoxy-D-manno-octulosonic acid transferase [Marinicella marina]MCX7553249.1 lipid IV(A) 3-deoxy-D-manno-octulosonic acid transferase [Marinicella marina]MDJ1138981.1 lipid IV(A) 3-deoxy-D-manno-octulosonic acid transferase [Marinicella marina]